MGRVLGSVLLLMLLVPLVASAQTEEIPKLDPAQLTGDWVVLSEVSADATELTEGYTAKWLAYLGGPAGARVEVVVVRVEDSPAAIRGSWEGVNELFDNLRVEFDADYASERDLQDRAGPTECSDLRRMEGTDALASPIPIGVTLCAADPDLIVLATASGEVNGLSGYRASDAVVELILRHEGVGTPIPS